ncbi:MAG: 3-dehydroquinate synthase II [Desulfobacterales bacterium]|nr:3-dehydroquinate synthase II [Desulfobacteraceae bacterium]MBT7087048.1 3-dehydroquinate synthase II [Desulfobacterales bacterium]MBT7697587.1 3-dehydroquinate synthase II [Desulfobacterales bacterium]
MRKIWVKVDPWDKEIVTTALEGGVDGIMVPEGFSEKVKELGKVQTISEDGDLKTGKDVITFKIKTGEDEEEILKLSQRQKVILQCSDWTIIPLENLIAKKADVIAQVQSYEEARTAFGILEKGVNHILFHTTDHIELKKALSLLGSETITTQLEEAEIMEVVPVGMGDRVCIDTCTSMVKGEGMLVGNTSSFLFLIHSESVSNPYVAPRPFRINAGAVHAYTRVPGGKTRYLSELESGDEVLITDYKGNTTIGIVGRLKIEKRPLMLIKAKVNDKDVATIVQNAETIRLTDPSGEPVSVVSLKSGDKVLVAVEEGGRHFGHKIDETITEK